MKVLSHPYTSAFWLVGSRPQLEGAIFSGSNTLLIFQTTQRLDRDQLFQDIGNPRLLTHAVTRIWYITCSLLQAGALTGVDSLRDRRHWANNRVRIARLEFVRV